MFIELRVENNTSKLLRSTKPTTMGGSDSLILYMSSDMLSVFRLKSKLLYSPAVCTRIPFWIARKPTRIFAIPRNKMLVSFSNDRVPLSIT